ncbi:Pleckstrin homology domain-containing protein [Infundibulicybe gibba]|nr:Pleckstrin homology domain-containing protein [Infundibulicybe gibba]
MHGKGPARFIHYEDEAIAGDEDVVPPAEVLERTGSAVDGTSAGAAVSDGGSSVGLNWGDIVLRDRMLVRVSYSKTEITGKHFDETIHRTTRNLRYEDWAEFMVVWRKDRIELYEDYNMPGKEWITGHKHLSFVILLKSTKTRLSIYSFVDMTFCITAPPTNPRRTTSGSHSIFHREKEGTNIFVFKTKSRTRAYDWTWHLWRHLGGIIPRNIEICNPALNTKVRIDIPEVDPAKGDEALSVFNRENVIELCTEALRSVGDWKTVIERQIDNGKNLELAWRVGSHVDWIWLSDDTEGRPRKWAVLCGLVLRESMKSAALEIRLAEHFPNSIHLKDGNRLLEPPAIEGYLERIKPNTQMKQSLYLSTHDGNLFTLSPAAAHPPDPPGLLPVHTDSPGKCLREAERIRGTKQIMGAFGVSDLRSILLVQEGLAKSQDKPRLKMKRSFELLLTTGHVVRFEAHSRRLAVEWIERLRALVVYWKQRHRLDAREEMDLAQARRPRLTPHTHVFLNDGNLPPETPADAAAPLPALGTLYNWCVLDGCKSILRGGKVYTRQGLRGQYKLVQLFLIPGYLVQFRINPGSSLHSSVKRKISLIDAYVCSGYFAALALPRGQYNPSAGAAPRRYQDGLEADDPEEDMLFMVWYRPHTPVAQGTESSIPKTVPALSAKRKLSIFRTRSKLERDAWCWALNSEIERMVRAEKDRENILRTTGKLPDI